jgi:ABC-type multidrug transport system fused ATPase/permease subunit
MKLGSKYFTHFRFFYSHLRHRIFIALVLSIVVGLLDGFGLAMFLPLLESVDGDAKVGSEALGNLGFLIDGLEKVGVPLNLKSILFMMLLFFSLKGVGKFAETYYRAIVQHYFVRSIRFQNIRLITNLRYKSFVSQDAGRIQNTLSGETERVVQAYTNYFMTMQMAVMLAVYIVLAFLANPQFALLVSLGGVISNLIFQTIYRRTKAISTQITVNAHEFQGLLIENISFFKYLKATAYSNLFADKLRAVVNRIEGGNLKIRYYGAILQAIREPISIGVVVVMILVQVTYFDQNFGLILLSLLFFYRSLTFLMAMQTWWNSFMNVSGSLENLSDFQKTLASDQESDGKLRFGHLGEKIELSNIGFSYGQRQILKSVDLEILRNKTYAFVGESGSGKTTLVNLLVGLMTPEEGRIYFDGIDSRELNVSSYQRRVGYITQDPVVFGDTIFNNVTLWSEDNPRNRERFWEVLEKAAISDFVAGLADREASVLGNNGINLSGGQKQRLSIARELYKDIDILVLDEATSSLDGETERLIQVNIEKLKGDLTILVVAHRLSTIKNADQIVMLDNGRIVERGTFDQLIDRSDKFKKSVALQDF